MNLILTLFSIILIYLLFKALTKLLKIPIVISLIIFGIFITLPGFREIFIGTNTHIIEIFGNLGLFALLFLAGLESSWKEIKKEEKDAGIIAIFASTTPFFLGFLTFLFIFDFSWEVSFIIGLSMSLTAEATKARILFDLGKLKTKVASTLVGAGVIDDILGLSLFSIFMFLVGTVEFKEYLLLIGILVSFAIGIIVQKYARKHHITKKLEIIFDNIFVPFFFVSLGLQFDIFSQSLDLKLLLIVILLALSGKLIGVLLTKPFVNFSYKQLYLMGWSMNSRGGVELALALIALNATLISSQIYSVLVLMSLITTMIFPFIMTSMINNNKHIMD